MRKKIDSPAVQIGERAIVDRGVTLGYPPSRGEDKVLMIGPDAHARSGTVIYGGTQIGRGLETGHNVLIREQNVIGDNLRIWTNSVIDYGCRIGNNVKIHTGVYVAQNSVIEDDAFLAPGVQFANDVHPGCPDSQKCMKGPTVKKGAQIGVNSCLLPRVTIGEYSVVGSGSVVTKDIPPRVVAYGNPARVVCSIDDLVCTTGLRHKPYDALGGKQGE